MDQEAASDAIIKTVDQKTGEEFTATAAKDGTYELRLPKARYDISTSLAGFGVCRVEGVDIGGRLVTADAKLELPWGDSVSVVGKAPYCNNKKLDRLIHKKS